LFLVFLLLSRVRAARSASKVRGRLEHARSIRAARFVNRVPPVRFRTHIATGSASIAFASQPGQLSVQRGRVMAILASRIDTAAPEFRANAQRMRALVGALEQRRAEAAAGGPDKARERHLARGKLLPRDRVM